jgi:predicted transcriptional regulator
MLSRDARLGFRDQLRQSRDNAIADAEGFQVVLFAIERLGAAALNRVATLGDYEKCLRLIAETSSLAFRLPSKFRSLLTPFDVLYTLVRIARNDALHQGAYARHLTSHAIELSLILEDALTTDSKMVADFMVKDVLFAQLWEPLAYLRQKMLANSFSFLPVRQKDNTWALISDRSVALALHRADRKREEILGMTLQQAIDEKLIVPDSTRLIPSDLDVNAALSEMKSQPVLVYYPDKPNEVIGIVTSFDLM